MKVKLIIRVSGYFLGAFHHKHKRYQRKRSLLDMPEKVWNMSIKFQANLLDKPIIN
ncbi:hypothetical protein [Nostoc sp. CHAB 5836]|uniref:hypothetical protein n=1 Tax=Nostoc sp. CHAB 5836 TaxID=2780404 RepID=UPI001E2EDA21|nr:hypothetical protein [Nostoc sp. CHAB 5836]